MNKKFALLLMFSMIFLAIPIASAAVTDTAVAYYKFDDGTGLTSTDEGGSYDFTLTTDTWVTGFRGQALNIEQDHGPTDTGVNGTVGPNGGWTVNNQMTIAVMLRNTTALDINNGDFVDFIYTDDYNIYPNFGLDLNGPGYYWNDYFGFDPPGDSGAGTGVPATEFTGAAEGWDMHVVTLNLDTGNHSYFINGVLHDSVAVTDFGWESPELTLYLFQGSGATEPRFGWHDIDELSFYDYELTSTEVSDLYDETLLLVEVTEEGPSEAGAGVLAVCVDSDATWADASALAGLIMTIILVGLVLTTLVLSMTGVIDIGRLAGGINLQNAPAAIVIIGLLFLVIATMSFLIAGSVCPAYGA